MKTISPIIILTVWIIVFISVSYLWVRNHRVYNFKRKILELVFSNKTVSNKIMDLKLNLLNKYSYDEMMLSFKKLNLESWYTKEEIEILNL